jgi:small-conductance mechanosensitive channel
VPTCPPCTSAHYLVGEELIHRAPLNEARFQPMNDLELGEHDLLHYLRPDTVWGALGYLVLFMIVAWALARALRTAVNASMVRKGHLDRTTISFLQQLGTALIWVIAIILYAHLIPALRSMGTALLAGASVASVVIGLAAQSTLGNLVAGIAITIYRPFRLGDTLRLCAPRMDTSSRCLMPLPQVPSRLT